MHVHVYHEFNRTKLGSFTSYSTNDTVHVIEDEPGVPDTTIITVPDEIIETVTEDERDSAAEIDFSNLNYNR